MADRLPVVTAREVIKVLERLGFQRIRQSGSLVAVVTLLLLLIQQEVLTVSDSLRGRALSRVLNIAIAPLLLTFLLIVVVNVGKVLR